MVHVVSARRFVRVGGYVLQECLLDARTPTHSVFVLQRGCGVLRAPHRSWVQQVVPQELLGKRRHQSLHVSSSTFSVQAAGELQV